MKNGKIALPRCWQSFSLFLQFFFRYDALQTLKKVMIFCESIFPVASFAGVPVPLDVVKLPLVAGIDQTWFTANPLFTSLVSDWLFRSDTLRAVTETLPLKLELLSGRGELNTRGKEFIQISISDVALLWLRFCWLVI